MNLVRDSIDFFKIKIFVAKVRKTWKIFGKFEPLFVWPPTQNIHQIEYPVFEGFFATSNLPFPVMLILLKQAKTGVS